MSESMAARALSRAAQANDERLQLRGCRNCLWWSGGQCRAGAPSAAGWPSTEGSDWCGSWQWIVEPRQVWTSAIAPAERLQAQEGVPF